MNQEIKPATTVNQSSNSEFIRDEAKSAQQKSYWAKMTLKQRSAEQKRRRAMRKYPAGLRKLADKAIPGLKPTPDTTGADLSKRPAARQEGTANASGQGNDTITIPPAMGSSVKRLGGRIYIEQPTSGIKDLKIVCLFPAEAKLVAGAILNLVGAAKQLKN